ncbi:uncharacterized protein [Palaemon carinicauda]|uniref:uncharacterized protein isoform X2 n=1 Tax=Palaemon carinicauda TaxID=392227 RepID=UPI0035B680A3
MSKEAPADGLGHVDIRGMNGGKGSRATGRLFTDGLGTRFEDLSTYLGQFVKAILKAGKRNSAVVWKSEAERKFQVKDFGKLSSLWDESQEKEDLKEEENAKNGGIQDSPEAEEGGDDYSLEEVIRSACENGNLEKVTGEGDHIYIFVPYPTPEK